MVKSTDKPLKVPGKAHYGDSMHGLRVARDPSLHKGIAAMRAMVSGAAPKSKSGSTASRKSK